MTESFTSGYLSAFFSIVGTRIVLRLREADEQKLRGTLGATPGTALAGATDSSDKDPHNQKKGTRRFRRDRRRDFLSTQEISHDMAFRTVTTAVTAVSGEDEPVSSDLGGWELDVEGADIILEEPEDDEQDHGDDADAKLDNQPLERIQDPPVIELDYVGRSSSSVPFFSRVEALNLGDPREPSPSRTLVNGASFPNSPV